MNGYGWAIKIPTSMEWESDNDNRFNDYDDSDDYDGYEYDSEDQRRFDEDWWVDFDRRNAWDQDDSRYGYLIQKRVDTFQNS
ncbi:unnamed protein product [Clonostachys rosea f. rosea IK726]|uniref:Uncharacterized protein n=1 Tax=Clonostachys rosea f. rosea IK726 TaxID=1349383 RepID=A0ACA9UHZ3_BIOOC|nr:unnamed protein product [Clonostachys rosea f. rosea IK726]